MSDTELTTDRLLMKHDAALRAFLVKPDFKGRAALHDSHVGLEKRMRELKWAELTAFLQRYCKSA
jgi:hypothetical protein